MLTAAKNQLSSSKIIPGSHTASILIYEIIKPRYLRDITFFLIKLNRNDIFILDKLKLIRLI
jgi:hypothetical protein